LRVFENRPLRKVFALIRDEITSAWRKPRNDEIRDFQFSPNVFTVYKIREDQMFET
jgi:hypothetical protein